MTPPDGWEDRTDTAETKSGTDYQAVYEGPTTDGVVASLAIDEVDPPRRVGDPTLGRAVADAREALEDGGATLRPARDAVLDGTPARITDATAPDGSRVRQLVAVRGERIWSVTLVAAAGAFEARAAAFEQAVSSWRWD